MARWPAPVRRAGNGLPSAGPPPGRRRKPVIAAANGVAVGIGATMLLPMDVRLAAEDARFGFVFTRRGIVPEACSSWFLPRLVGIVRTLEWAFTGRVFDAAEALDGRLVRRVLPADALLPAAQAPAREIADHAAPVSVALTRQMMRRMLGALHPMSAHRIGSRAVFARRRSDDAREGVGAFLEKRRARFTDRASDGMRPWFSVVGRARLGAMERALARTCALPGMAGAFRPISVIRVNGLCSSLAVFGVGYTDPVGTSYRLLQVLRLGRRAPAGMSDSEVLRALLAPAEQPTTDCTSREDGV